jgi:hypothetical protein
LIGRSSLLPFVLSTTSSLSNWNRINMIKSFLCVKEQKRFNRFENPISGKGATECFEN